VREHSSAPALPNSSDGDKECSCLKKKRKSQYNEHICALVAEITTESWLLYFKFLSQILMKIKEA
jgi:hypothetical protein